jgi:hypothetical protein
VAGIGVPMEEIDRLLRQLPDRRVVIIADTCHSAGVVGMPGARDSTPVAAITNDYLKASIERNCIDRHAWRTVRRVATRLERWSDCPLKPTLCAGGVAPLSAQRARSASSMTRGSAVVPGATPARRGGELTAW